MHRKRQKERAVSLLELLVCVLIVTILAALIFPVAKKVLASAKSTQCLQNLRSVGVALAAFSGDNENAIPPRSWGYDRSSGKPAANLRPWCSRLYNLGYATDARIFYCPSFAPYNPANARNKLEIGGSQATYGMRTWGPPGGGSTGYLTWREEDKKLAMIIKPSEFFLVADSYWSELETQGYGITPGAKTQAAHLRHEGRANALFADGHVEPKDAEYFDGLDKPDVQAAYSAGSDKKPGAKIYSVTLEETLAK